VPSQSGNGNRGGAAEGAAPFGASLAVPATLNEREQHILKGRRLRDEAMTLADLGHIYGVSRERVRQIEARAFEKLQRAMLSAAANQQGGTRLCAP
jgi:hypothetical protein